MKKAVLLLTVLMMILLTACGAEEEKPARKDASPSEVYAKMLEQVAFPGEMVKLADEDLLNTFGLEASQFEEYVYAVCEDALLAETVLLIKVKDGTDKSAVKETMNRYIEDQTLMFNSYVPEQGKVAGDAVVVENGSCICMLMLSKVSELKKIAADMLGAK